MRIILFERQFIICLLIMLTSHQAVRAQYAPPAEFPGSTAIHKDDARFTGWAVKCTVVRGPMDLSDPQQGKASAGDSSMACGKAQENGVVSLGDGGSATCTFAYPVKDGPGFDFAVFENSFSDNYLELAFVEVSDDGENFYRFSAHSLTDTIQQVASFDTINPRRIDQLAGKYRGGYGTPFDLADLQHHAGLDLSRITHVRIVDVVGALSSSLATRDAHGRKINDPWPTAFPSGGFDLDAIGVIHHNPVQSLTEFTELKIRAFPNPAAAGDQVLFSGNTAVLYDARGMQCAIASGGKLETAMLAPGLYILRSGKHTIRIVIR